jgi:hypothetical protein
VKTPARPDDFEIAERYGGPDYGLEGARILASAWVLENRSEFVAWLDHRNIDAADALAWAERMETLHRIALRGLPW